MSRRRPVSSSISAALVAGVLGSPVAALLGATPVVVATSGLAAPHASRVLLDQTLAVALGGKEVGTMTAHDEDRGDAIVLVRKSVLRLQRGTTTAVLDTSTTVTLSPDLSPRSYHFERKDASGTLVTDAVIVDGGRVLEMTTTQNGATVKNRVPLPAGATFSVALEHRVRRAPKDGTKIEGPIVLEELGAVAPMTTTVTKTKAGTFLVRATFQGMTTDEEIDAQGRTLVARTPAVGIVAYPPGHAPADLGGGASDLLAVSTWTTSPVPRDAHHVVYRVHTPDAATFTIPEDKRQHVLQRTATTVDVDVKDGAATSGALSSSRRAELTAATPYEAIDDPRIVQAARNAIVGAKNDDEKVAQLAHFVFEHVQKKGLDRGYAPAIATLESRAGDCTEHSVLLSALLRSQGFATRIVDGVIVDGTHAGYHEWVEVQLGARGFVPVDPTFDDFPAGAERLKLAEGSTSPTEQLTLSLAAARLLKTGVRIEVLSAQ